MEGSPRMLKAVFLASAALALFACSDRNQGRSTEAQDAAARREAGEADAQEPDPKMSEGAMADEDWRQTFSPDKRYFNRTSIPVPVFADATADEMPIGRAAPDAGGTIETCADNGYCRIDFGGGLVGYVDMANMSEDPAR